MAGLKRSRSKQSPSAVQGTTETPDLFVVHRPNIIVIVPGQFLHGLDPPETERRRDSSLEELMTVTEFTFW